jgi:hypothetical protein
MQESLITFETAKLAKEKGFDWASKCYHSDGTFQDRQQLSNYNHKVFIDGVDYLISAPTQSLLQKWLREVHKIEIVVHPKEHSSLGFMYAVDVFFTDQLNHISYDGVYSLYKTYEEALEFGLQEALKFIL